jgi:NAD(P)-dependent dehydrogenase (short-subunit alcohol dehydrogenase family)
MPPAVARADESWFDMAVTVESRPVALVTGANRGIGLAVVIGLARLGHRVALGARNATHGAQVAAELRADGLDVEFLHCDVTDDASVRAAAENLGVNHGRLDILVNNAAIKLEMAPSPPSESTVAVVRETFETNVFGTMRVILAMLPLLRRSDAPRIVNVSSGLGSITLAATPGTKYAATPLLSYNPSKAAINSLTVQFANEFRGSAFKINVADPGYTNTDMTRSDARQGGSRTPTEAAEVIIELATLPQDGPTGTFRDERGELPW